MLVAVSLGDGLRHQLLAQMLAGFSSVDVGFFLNLPHKGEHIDVQMAMGEKR